MQQLKEKYAFIQKLGICYFIGMLIYQVVSTAPPPLWLFLTIGAALLIYVLYAYQEPTDKLSYFFLCTFFVLMILCTCNEILLLVIPNSLHKLGVALSCILDFIGMVAGFSLCVQDTFHSDFLGTMSMFCRTGKSKESNELDEEDAILGNIVSLDSQEKDPETGIVTGRVTQKPLILPAKDRFLHMLILGATGSGKTSQSIIPMIWRDMQIINKIVGITVLEPKGDLAEKVNAMVLYHNQQIVEARERGMKEEKIRKEYGVEKTIWYFNPILNDCPYFNPLMGDETDVVENLASTFVMFNADSSQFFKDMSDGLVRKGVKVIKRVYGDDATLNDFNTLILNIQEGGKTMLSTLKNMIHDPYGNPISAATQKENDELIDWFTRDYYAGMDGGTRGAPKTYEHTSAIRTQVGKLLSNPFLRKVLNPPRSTDPEYESSLHIPRINFDEALEKGYIISMSTAQGAFRELGRFLGYFIILQLQSSVFRRTGTEDTRIHNMLYIDEFQVYANPGFGDMLTMGRSYRVASHLATQARAQIANGRDGDNFLKLVNTNARNKIIYPGGDIEDAKYYSNDFGEVEVVTTKKSYTQKKFFSTLDDKRMSYSENREIKPRFSPSEIKYRPFGQVICSIIRKNSIIPPVVTQLSYIPKEMNDILNRMVLEDNETRLSEHAKSLRKQSLTQDIFDPCMDLAKNEEVSNMDSASDFDFVQPDTNLEPITVGALPPIRRAKTDTLE